MCAVCIEPVNVTGAAKRPRIKTMQNIRLFAVFRYPDNSRFWLIAFLILKFWTDEQPKITGRSLVYLRLFPIAIRLWPKGLPERNVRSGQRNHAAVTIRSRALRVRMRRLIVRERFVFSENNRKQHQTGTAELVNYATVVCMAGK